MIKQLDGTLQLTPEAMRALGYHVVDMIVEHVRELPGKPVSRTADRPTMEERLREPLPLCGTDIDAVFKQLQEDVLGNIIHSDHPRYFAFIPSPGNFVGAMADALASGLNIFAGTWLESPGPAQVELVTVDWLRQLCGLPAEAGGLFVSGGSVANLTALSVARRVRLGDKIGDAVIYYSDQTHFSVERGARVIGFTAEQLRKLPSDRHFRLDLDALRQAVAGDRRKGRVPFCVVANAGTTSSGAVDPLFELADFCREEQLWLHADGAYGAAAVLSQKGRALLEGLGRVDSLVLDPHKWLFQPYEIGCVMVRNSGWLADTFRVRPEYLQDVECREEEVNFCDYGIQLTRGFRALKLWLSLKVFGLETFQKAIQHGIEAAEYVQKRVKRYPSWEVTTPAQLGVLTVRYVPPGCPEKVADLINRLIIEEMIADGFAMISSTVLGGKTVLRFCTLNPRTTRADLEETVERLDRFARKIASPYQSNYKRSLETAGH